MNNQIATYNHINSVLVWAYNNKVPSQYGINMAGKLIWEANYKKYQQIPPDFNFSEAVAKPMTAIDVIKACDFLELQVGDCEKASKIVSNIKKLAINILPSNLHDIKVVREMKEYKTADWCIQ